MATTPLHRPSTTEQALTGAYLAQDLEFTVGTGFSVECDDDDIDITVRIQVAGTDQLEYIVPGGVAAVFTPDRGSKVLLNIKAASGTPNAKINVDNAVEYYPRTGVSTDASITAESLGIIDTTLPAAGLDGERKDILVDVYGRIRLAAENTDQDKLLVQSHSIADTALPTAVADGAQVQPLADVYGRARQAVEDTAQNANRVSEVDPISEHGDTWKLLTLENVANGAIAYEYFSMKGAKHFGVQTRKTGGADTVTWTIETTIQADDVPASCTYDDMTSDITGAANWTDDGQVWCSVVTPVDGVRIGYVTTGGAGDADIEVYVKRMY